MTIFRPRLVSAALVCTALLGAALGSAGCAGPREATGELPDTYPNHSFADIRQALARGSDTLRAFRAQARLSVTTPERSGRFSARIRARRSPAGDSLYLRLSPGLGIEAARILVTPDSFFVHNAIQNELTYGALADAGALLPAPLRTGRAFENLLGIVTPRAALDWRVRASTEEEGANRYVLTSGGERLTRTLTVDPSRWRALRYTERTGDGTLLEERTFSEFGRFSGVFVPRRVALRQPQNDNAASVYYRDLTLDPPDLQPFELDVPSGTERILVAR
jgi:hypothetical protein